MSLGSTPWGIIGDFNATLHPSERSRTSNHAASSRDFQDFLSSTGLIDIGFKGGNFTLANNNYGSRFATARLDRVLLNKPWLDVFPDPTLTHLTRHA